MHLVDPPRGIWNRIFVHFARQNAKKCICSRIPPGLGNCIFIARLVASGIAFFVHFARENAKKVHLQPDPARPGKLHFYCIFLGKMQKKMHFRSPGPVAEKCFRFALNLPSQPLEKCLQNCPEPRGGWGMGWLLTRWGAVGVVRILAGGHRSCDCKH